MKKTLLFFPIIAILTGCSSGPRDATNDPEVKAMLKGVQEQGKMPASGGGAAQRPPSGDSASPAPAPAGG